MKDSEKVIERKLNELVKQKGGISIKLLTNQFIGLPDRMCLFPNGRIIFIEVKTTGEKPRKIQEHVHKMISALGFTVVVVDTINGMYNTIEKFLKNE